MSETGGEGHLDVASAASKLEGQHPAPTPEASVPTGAKDTSAGPSDPVQGASYPATDRSDDVPHVASSQAAAVERGGESRAAPSAAVGDQGSEERSGAPGAEAATASRDAPAAVESANGGSAMGGPAGNSAIDPQGGDAEGVESYEDARGPASDEAASMGEGADANDREREIAGRVATGGAEEGSGPQSPASVFAGQDGGHVTEAGEDLSKGGAIAMELARRRSLGEEESLDRAGADLLASLVHHGTCPSHTLFIPKDYLGSATRWPDRLCKQLDVELCPLLPLECPLASLHLDFWSEPSLHLSWIRR